MESAEYHVCLRADRPTPFTDNIFDLCCKCGEKVQLRPGGPTVPKKICLPCAMPDMVRAQEKGELETVVSRETIEVMARKLRGH